MKYDHFWGTPDLVSKSDPRNGQNPEIDRFGGVFGPFLDPKWNESVGFTIHSMLDVIGVPRKSYLVNKPISYQRCSGGVPI